MSPHYRGPDKKNLTRNGVYGDEVERIQGVEFDELKLVSSIGPFERVIHFGFDVFGNFSGFWSQRNICACHLHGVS